MTTLTRDISQHQQVVQQPGVLQRTPSPWFAPPVPAWMRSPGTNYVAIITAPDSPGGGPNTIWNLVPAS